ncbi:MAG TPA: chemotaxis protein CheW [Polyangiaceae bacterium]
MQRDEVDAVTRGQNGGEGTRERGLLCRVGAATCFVPLTHVVETMRPLPIRALANAAPFVLGVAIVRGAATMVVDAAMLLSAPSSRTAPSRFVLLRVGRRAVALAVDEVVGIRDVTSASFVDLPPLLRAMSSDAVRAIGTLDQELTVVLQAAKLVLEDAWAAFEGEAAS